MTISTLQKGYRSKQYTPEEIVEHYLSVSKQNNKIFNTYITLCAEEARETVRQYSKKSELPLAGIPFAVKDNFCTAGVRTTAASKVLNDFIPPYESTVTARLKKAGAIIIGKTNMDAWAHGSSTETSDYGPSKNPFDITRVPGGSSGGSATAVGAGLCPYAIGSETAGSIRLPASWCGIVGLKPTYGRVSRYGVIAMGSSLDSPGPMTRYVEDAALILQVIAGIDPYDATSSPNLVPNYREKLKEKNRYTIGVPREYLEGVNDAVAKQFEEQVEILKKMGHHIRRIRLISPRYAISTYTIIQRAEVSSNLARYDGIRYGATRNAFGAEAKRRMMFGAFTLSSGYYEAYYLKAQKVRTLIIQDFQKAFGEVDVILSPTTPTTALKLGESADNPMFGELMDILVEPSALAGLPGINMPAGLIGKLPIGIQFIAPWFQEEKLLNIAYQYEQETENYRIQPPHYYGKQ